MRDPDRIKTYCDVLAQAWKAVPDWRLGQFMENMKVIYHYETGKDLFYAEDEDFISFLVKFIEEE